MDADALKRIESFLRDHDSSWELQPKARQRQFEKADTAIQAMLTGMATAKQMMEDSRINISSVASVSGISRKTFYNNELLKAYVDHFTEENALPGISPNELQRLKDQNSALDDQVKAFVIRDIETENLRHENMQLAAEIKNLQIRNQNLETQYANALKKIQTLQKAVDSKRVVPFLTAE